MSAVVAEGYMEDGVVSLEPRVARIESDVANINETVSRLDKRVDRLDEKVDERFDRVDERFDKVDERFDKVDEKFERLDGKVNNLDKRMAVMEHDFINVRENQATLHSDLRDLLRSLDSKFVWIVTTMIAFGAALLATMAKGFHWLK